MASWEELQPEEYAPSCCDRVAAIPKLLHATSAPNKNMLQITAEKSTHVVVTMGWLRAWLGLGNHQGLRIGDLHRGYMVNNKCGLGAIVVMFLKKETNSCLVNRIWSRGQDADLFPASRCKWFFLAPSCRMEINSVYSHSMIVELVWSILS